MSGPTPPGPFEWPEDVQRKPQETISTIFGCKRALFQKCLFSFKLIEVFEGQVAKLPNEHPPFVALRPPPRAIWTDLRSCYPWGTPPPPPPSPTKNKKNLRKHQLCVFGPWRGPQMIPKGSRQRSHQRAVWHRKGLAPLVGPLVASLGDFGRPLGVCILSSLFSLLSPLFSLLSTSTGCF